MQDLNNIVKFRVVFIDRLLVYIPLRWVLEEISMSKP